MSARPTDGPLSERSIVAAALALLCGCGSGGGGAPVDGAAIAGPAGNIPFTSSVGTAPDYNPADVVGPACQSGDPNHLCLGLKYVVYEMSSGQPVVTQAQALTNLASINQLWSQCDVAFQIDEFDAVEPSDDNLNYSLTDFSELEDVRSAYQTIDDLLVVTTGTWNRSGSLGTTTANAWTAMPGGAPYGTVLEYPVGTFSNIIAHELGHYLNLVHISDATNLMNPVIYSTSATLSASECETARSAASYFWRRMLR